MNTVASNRRGAVVGVLGLVVVLGGCGGSSTTAPTSPASPPAPLGITETVTLTGSADPSCAGGGHSFEAAAGDVALTLVDTTGGVGLYGQVCAGGVDNNACTINQTRMVVGQTLTGTRQGISNQSVKMLTLNCGPGAAPPGPVAYTIRLTYQR